MRINYLTRTDKALFGFDLFLIIFNLSFLLLYFFLDHLIIIKGLQILSLLGLLPVLLSAFKSLIKREISVDLLASIALVFSIYSGEWYSASFITLMLAFARIFDLFTMAKTKSIIASLIKYQVEVVKIIKGETVKDININDIKVGDMVVVDAGDKIPVDGSVSSGSAMVDESSLTGESELVGKKVGDKVFTSTINESGSLVVKVEKIGKDTTLSKIIAMVEEASRNKSKAERIANTFTRWYIIAVLLVSLALYSLGFSTSFILSILLVVCADDIAVAVPLSFTSAISGLAKRGIVVKGSDALEQVSRLKFILTDKTGTLTKGKPKIVDIRTFGDNTREKALELFGMGASHSNHAVSRAIIKYLEENHTKIHNPETFEEVSGQGVRFGHGHDVMVMGRITFIESQNIKVDEAIKTTVDKEKNDGRAIVLLARNGEVMALISYVDELRPKMKDVILETKNLGVKEWHMLTGDNEKVAKKVAEELGLFHPHANMTPQSKLQFVKEFKKNHRGIVAYIGDGVNDAASLALADVSIAMGGIGSESAIEASDITIMHDHLNRLPFVLKTATKVRSIMYQSFVIWALTNTIGLALVFGGFIGPVGASAFNFITDFIPILNALRAGKVK